LHEIGETMAPTADIPTEIIKKFAALYQSNRISYGNWTPKNGKMFTTKEEYTDKNIKNHLSGIMGLGLVAINDDNKCWWGAIDIDNHSGEEININKIAKAIHDKGLPLIVCKSKSGGAHCYLFGSEPLPAHFVRSILNKWATDLGFQGSEVFPKQSRLVKKQLGNWINLPYFKSEQRLAHEFDKGDIKTLSLTEFMDKAMISRVDQSLLEDFMLVEHREAPPCIQQMMKNGVDSGHRNEGLYNLSVYLRKSHPDDYKERAFDINQTIFEKPLSFAEAKKTINSVSGNRDYRYKCLEEPCRSFCDSEVCLKREYGITSDEVGFLSRADMPEITGLKIYDMEPPIWEMKLNGTTVAITTSQFYNFQEFAKVVMEKLLIVVPPMKNKDWINVLAGLMSVAERVETPEDASTPGIIKEKLREFIYKADLKSNGRDVNDRAMIRRGMPVVQEVGVGGIAGRHVVFRGGDFVAFLKRTRSEELKGSMLWNALRTFGVTHTRLRVEGRVAAVWVVPVDEHGRTKLDPDYNDEKPPEKQKEEKGFQFKSEF